MADVRTTGLTRLSETGRTVADPTEDVRGLAVTDADGEDLGTVEDLLVDEQEGRVRFLEVEHGGILGFGATTSFLPVESVTGIEDDGVRVDQSRQRVAEAPRYDPDLADASDYYGNLYGYYGYAPFWTAGYVPPLYWTRRGNAPR